MGAFSFITAAAGLVTAGVAIARVADLEDKVVDTQALTIKNTDRLDKLEARTDVLASRIGQVANPKNGDITTAVNAAFDAYSAKVDAQFEQIRNRHDELVRSHNDNWTSQKRRNADFDARIKAAGTGADKAGMDAMHKRINAVEKALAQRNTK